MTDNRSIGEVLMDGDGRYSDLVRVDNLGDGTFLVYEKVDFFGPWQGFYRVHRLDPENEDFSQGAVNSYQQHEAEKQIIRKLNDLIMKQE
jgi:hypothetical protein